MIERSDKGRQLAGQRKLGEGFFVFFCCSWYKDGKQFSMFTQPGEESQWKDKTQQSEWIILRAVLTGGENQEDEEEVSLRGLKGTAL